MCDGLKFTFPDGKTICIPIYVEILKWPPPDPDPDPWRRAIEDLRTLVVVNQAIHNVRDQGARKQLGGAFNEAVRAISKELPAGFSIGDGLMKIGVAH